MKTRIFAISAILGLTALTGCVKDESFRRENDKNGISITLTAEPTDPMTKVAITGTKVDGYNTYWEVGDKIGVFTDFVGSDAAVRTDKNYNYQLSIAAGGVATDGKATFTGSLYSGSYAGTNTLYSYYPHHANSDNTYSGTRTFENVLCNLPAEQTMTASGSYDNDAAYMVGMPVRVDLSSSKAVTSSGLKFRHLCSFLNLTLKANTCTGVDAATEKILGVTLRATGKTLSGDFALNLATGAMTFESSVDSVAVAYGNATTNLADMSVWAIVNPFTLASSDNLQVVITTSKHKITKNISVAKAFLAKNVYTLNLTLNDATCTVTNYSAPQYEWTLVTSAANISNGTYVIAHCITSSGVYYYLPNAAASTPTANTGITVASNKLSNTVTSDMQWVLTANASSGYDIVSFADNTLKLGSTDSNPGIQIATSPANTNWKFADDSRATSALSMNITTGSNTRYICVYNAANWRAYTSLTATNNKGYLYLFKKTLVTTAPSIEAANILGVDAKGVTAATATYTINNSSETQATATCDGTIVTSASTSGLTLTYTVAANTTGATRSGSVTLALTDGTTKEITVAQNADVFTVTPATVSVGSASGATTTFSVTSTYDWSLTTSGTGYTVSTTSGTGSTDATIVTVTASAAGGASEASLGTITVTRAIDSKTSAVAVKQDAAGPVSTTTFDLTSGYTNGQKVTTATKDAITLTFSKGTGSTDPAWYTTGTAMRLYGSNTMTVDAGSSTITSIVITYAAGTSNTGTMSASTGSYSLSGATGTWTGSASSVLFTNTATSGYARIQKIVITY